MMQILPLVRLTEMDTNKRRVRLGRRRKNVLFDSFVSGKMQQRLVDQLNFITFKSMYDLPHTLIFDIAEYVANVSLSHWMP